MNLNLTWSRRWRPRDATSRRCRSHESLRVSWTYGGSFAIRSTQVRALEGGSSTTKQILIDQDLRGWKEVEYEVPRQRPFARRRDSTRLELDDETAPGLV